MPDLILTHHDDDRHQAHRLVSQLTWNTWRDHMILEYEIMKYDGDLGRPNVFVPLSQDVCQDKIGSLLEVFPSQARRQWFNEEAFWSLLRLRGIECNAPFSAGRSILRAQDSRLVQLGRRGASPRLQTKAARPLPFARLASLIPS